jgi:Ca-activated chloride channel family protein
MKRVLLRILAITLTLNIIVPSFAAGLIIIENPEVETRILPPPDRPPHYPVPPPNFRLPRPIHRFTPLEIRSVKTTAKIKDQVAQTKIEQEFYNPNPRQLEGTFILPLPKGAHLDKFRMEVNGKMTEAELLTAEKAKGIYEEIVRKAKDPALLEYVGRDLIKVRIFPIEPNSTKRIEVSYAQVLKSDNGLFEYKLPLNTTKYASAPMKNFSLKLELETATSLKTIYSPTHNVEIKRHGDKSATIGFEQSELTTEKDLELFYSAEKSELGLSLLTYRKGDEDGYFMLLATPGFDAGKGKVIPKDVVFVLDTSGSMSGKKLEQAKKALIFCVNNLNDQDQFEIIRFSTETEALFGKITPVSSGSKEKAEEFVKNLKTIGGTAINDALHSALETCATETTRPKLIVFLTDGRPTVGDTTVEGILKTVKTRSAKLTRIFAFGVGTDVNTQLLDRIAEETSAVSQYVLPEEDIEIKVSSFFSKINDPVLADLSLDYGEIRTSKVHPGKLPDLFKGQELIVLGRYKDQGKTTVKLRGKIGDEAKEFTYNVEFPKSDTDREFVPRLWATRRVGHLLEEIRNNGEGGELKEEVTQLAKQYGIVTPYTSYLVTEDQPVVALQGLEPRDRLQAESLGRAPLATDGLSLLKAESQATRRYASAAAPRAEVRQRLSQTSDEYGAAAVAGARYNYALKSALNEQQVQQAPAEVNLFAQTGELHVGKVVTQSQVQQQRFVGGRAFRFDQGFWTETTLDAAKDPAVTRVEFDSKEYWDLVSKHPELRDVLALGTQVKFQFGTRFYEIHDKKI